jgi:hypothetical protein
MLQFMLQMSTYKTHTKPLRVVGSVESLLLKHVRFDNLLSSLMFSGRFLRLLFDRLSLTTVLGSIILPSNISVGTCLIPVLPRSTKKEIKFKKGTESILILGCCIDYLRSPAH